MDFFNLKKTQKTPVTTPHIFASPSAGISGPSPKPAGLHLSRSQWPLWSLTLSMSPLVMGTEHAQACLHLVWWPPAALMTRQLSSDLPAILAGLGTQNVAPKDGNVPKKVPACTAPTPGDKEVAIYWIYQNVFYLHVESHPTQQLSLTWPRQCS